jgi:hypothetical protein
MSYLIIFHPQAQEEYIEAHLWYELAQQGLGDRFEQMVEQRLLRISENPESYKVSKKAYREVSIDVFPYTIVYKINKKERQVYISAVYHTKRNPKGKYRK